MSTDLPEIWNAMLDRVYGSHSAAVNVAYCPSSEPFQRAQCNFNSALSDARRLADVVAPTTVYAFMYNSCTHESAAAVMSLHVTKAGAWRAMRKFLWDCAVQDQENVRLHGFATPDPVSWRRHYIQAMSILP